VSGQLLYLVLVLNFWIAGKPGIDCRRAEPLGGTAVATTTTFGLCGLGLKFRHV